MLTKLKQKRSEGFTIIEVMIVLAIAGLILLVVFLAVPALQRNSRNTQRKSDVGRLGSAATTVVSNNNGSMAQLTTANLTSEVGTLGYYDTSVAGNVTASVLASGGTATNPNNKDKVIVVGNAKCNGSNATYAIRQIAVLYSLEAGSGGVTQVCIDQ